MAGREGKCVGSVGVCGDGARTRRRGNGWDGGAEKEQGVPSTLSPILPICRIVHKNGRDNPVCYCYVNRFHLLSSPIWR
jgi:hypothetical protein